MARSRILGKIDLMSPTQRIYLSDDEVKKLGQFRQGISKLLKTRFYELPKDWRSRKKNIRMLFQRYSEFFEYWYYPGLLDINEWSLSLATLGNRYFEDWWDPENFDWHYIGTLSQNNRKYFTHWYDPSKINPDDLSYLASNCSSEFDVWWNKDYYPESRYLTLVRNCHNHIKKWWNSDIIFRDKNLYSKYYIPQLLIHAPDDFDLWWNPDKYDYSCFCPEFIEYVPEHFYKWFDKDKIPDSFWDKYSWAFAAELSDLFNDWFDKSKFNYGMNRYKRYKSVRRHHGRHYLIQFCSDHFHKWWDKRRIRATRPNLKLMEEYCYEHRGDWGSDFIVLELQEECDDLTT